MLRRVAGFTRVRGMEDEEEEEEEAEEEEEDVEDARSCVSKPQRLRMALSRRIREECLARVASAAAMVAVSSSHSREKDSAEADLDATRAAVRAAEASFDACRRDYGEYQRSIGLLYAPREIAEERRQREALKREMERAAEKLQETSFALTKKEEKRRRRLEVANRRRRSMTAPVPVRVPSRGGGGGIGEQTSGGASTALEDAAERGDTQLLSPAATSSMTTSEIISRAKTVMRRDTHALKRGVAMVEEMKSIGAATAVELQRQATVMRSVDTAVDGVSHDLRTAGKALRQLIRGVHFDRCQKLLIVLCVMAALALLVFSAMRWSAATSSAATTQASLTQQFRRAEASRGVREPESGGGDE